MQAGIARGGGTVASTSTNREVTAPRKPGEVTGGEKLLLLDYVCLGMSGSKYETMANIM